MHNRSVFYTQQPNQATNVLSFCLALAIHGLLFLILYVGVQWHSQPLSGLEAEIWTTLPEPDMPVPPKTSGQVAPEANEQDSDVGMQARLSKKLPPQQQTSSFKPSMRDKEEKRKAAQPLEQQQVDKTVQRLQKLRAEQDRAAQLARLRQVVQASSGSGGTQGSESGTDSSGIARYIEKVRRHVKPRIFFDADSVVGNPTTVVKVQLAPDGALLSKQLVKSSGNPAWDTEVLRALDRSSPLPKDTDGKAPPSFTITVRPKD